jgi:hypothetical protein
MAEQDNSILGLSGSESTRGTSGVSPKKAKSTGSPIEQKFDPLTGKELNSGEGLIQQVKSTASDAYETATTKANEKLEEHKSNLSSGLSNVATNIRQLGSNLSGAGSNDQVSRITSEFSSTAAKKIEQAADYFERKDINAMYRDVEGLARNNPAWFIGGAFALGFLAARFFKSSAPKQYRQAAGEPFRIPQQTRPQTGGSAARGL